MSGKEEMMIQMFKAALAEGKNGVFIVPTAATRARLIWNYRLPKGRVKVIEPAEGPFPGYFEGEFDA